MSRPLALPRIGALALGACLAALATLSCGQKHAAVACWVTYGGEAKRLEFPATISPYTVKPVDVAGRFAFKVLYVREPWQAASLNVYAYQRTSEGDRLLQEGKYLPPFSRAEGTRYGFTGRQLVYSLDQRELEYWCEVSR
jgi:hypothetical protein